MHNSQPQPTHWLTELARIRPAKWKWNRAIRAAVCIALPLAAGILAGNLGLGVWMSIASLMVVGGEGNGSYASRFKMLAVCTSVGALGCLVGYIDFLPWAWIVLIMACFGFLGGIISSYGPALSLGSLQFLVLAAVAVGHPQIAPFWLAMVYYIAGIAFYALVLGIEALLVRVRPQQKTIANLLKALAALAQSRAAQQIEKAQSAKPATASPATEPAATTPATEAVTAQINTLYAEALGDTARRANRTGDKDALWMLLKNCDRAFAQIMSEEDPLLLERTAASLGQIADAILRGQKTAEGLSLAEDGSAATPLQTTVQAIAASVFSTPSAHTRATDAVQRAPRHNRTAYLSRLRARLLPTRDTLHTATVLALCTGMAYAAHWFDKEYRWYWIPLTIAIVVKPDYGSLFARSLLRSLGVLGGALVGTAILLLIPKGIYLAVALGVCAAFIPWAGQRSYALLGVVITPLILVLIDLTVPGDITANYAAQRILGTLIAAGIVLVFGYFLWPRAHRQKIADSFTASNNLIADYLLAAAGKVQPQNGEDRAGFISNARRHAYARLAQLRNHLQRMMAEPPPACNAATAWLPIVAGTERICDAITAYSVRQEALTPADANQPQITELAEAIRHSPQADITPQTQPALPLHKQQLTDSIRGELDYIRSLTHS